MDGAETHWRPATAARSYETRPPLSAMTGRGLVNRCPACGRGRVFDGYLRVASSCGPCGAELGRIRADDAPPYFTILAVGHIIVPLLLWADRAWEPEMLTLSAIFLPLTLVLSLLFLRPIKGAMVGLMYGLDFGKADV